LTYLKAVVVGMGTGMLAAVLWVSGALFLPMYVARLICSLQTNCGAGAVGASVGSGSALLVALIGFAIGFWWIIRRARRRQSADAT
jgi:hypothetical protein